MATFNDHYQHTDGTRKPLLVQMHQHIQNLSGNLVERITKAQRLAYSKPGGTIFLELKVERHEIEVRMIDVPDPLNRFLRIPATHKWGRLFRRFEVKSQSDLAYAFVAINTAYQRA